MKVCVFWGGSFEFPKTGTYERIYQLLYNLTLSKHEIELYVQGQTNKKYDLDGIKVNTIEYPSFLKSTMNTRLFKSMVAKLKIMYGISYLASLYPVISKSANDAIKSSDIVLLEDPFQLCRLLTAKRYNKPTVMDLRAFYLPYFSKKLKYTLKHPILFLKLTPIALLEIVTLRLCSKIIVVSDEERDLVSDILKIPKTKISTIPNGINISDFMTDNLNQRQVIKDENGIGKNDIVAIFVGDLNGPHNFYACEYIVRQLSSQVFSKYGDQVHFLIVGPYNSLPNDFLKNKQVKFTGFVNDLQAYINASDICMAPLTFGAGTKTKMLAYMASGKTIITTEIGAEGLNLTNGKDAIICDIKSMNKEFIDLIENQNKMPYLGKNAFQKSLEYDWKKLALRLEKILMATKEEEQIYN